MVGLKSEWRKEWSVRTASSLYAVERCERSKGGHFSVERDVYCDTNSVDLGGLNMFVKFSFLCNEMMCEISLINLAYSGWFF